MSIYSSIASLGFMLCLYTIAANAADDGFKCKTRTDLVGPCWSVHGRLRVGNGNPSTRIWPIGTMRLLGVQDQFFDNDEESASPEEIRKYGFTAQIFADYMVCPLTKEKSGEMQIVCISSAKHIHVEKWLDAKLNEIKPPIWLTPPDTGEY
jgi:hypothetical protein